MNCSHCSHDQWGRDDKGDFCLKCGLACETQAGKPDWDRDTNYNDTDHVSPEKPTWGEKSANSPNRKTTAEQVAYRRSRHTTGGDRNTGDIQPETHQADPAKAKPKRGQDTSRTIAIIAERSSRPKRGKSPAFNGKASQTGVQGVSGGGQKKPAKGRKRPPSLPENGEGPPIKGF